MSGSLAGFLSGQVVAYCERIRRGMSVVCELSFPREYGDTLIHSVITEGCRSLIDEDNERVTLWIYRDDVAERLIEQLHGAAPTELTIWAAGKLFGYSDPEVLGFIRQSKEACVKSAFAGESSPPPCSGSQSSGME